MSDYQPGDTVLDVFYHPTAGLTDADFTKLVFKNGVATLVAVAVNPTAEANFYKFSFTTDSDDEVRWSVDVAETSNPLLRLQRSYYVQNAEPATLITLDDDGDPVESTLNEDLAYIRMLLEQTLQTVRQIQQESVSMKAQINQLTLK